MRRNTSRTRRLIPYLLLLPSVLLILGIYGYPMIKVFLLSLQNYNCLKISTPISRWNTWEYLEMPALLPRSWIWQLQQAMCRLEKEMCPCTTGSGICFPCFRNIGSVPGGSCWNGRKSMKRSRKTTRIYRIYTVYILEMI